MLFCSAMKSQILLLVQRELSSITEQRAALFNTVEFEKNSGNKGKQQYTDGECVTKTPQGETKKRFGSPESG